jgi:hypothetical protein
MSLPDGILFFMVQYDFVKQHCLLHHQACLIVRLAWLAGLGGRFPAQNLPGRRFFRLPRRGNHVVFLAGERLWKKRRIILSPREFCGGQQH